ncbi:MAG: outer membrane beta-barrel domain-containing protein [Persicimonas sp.]
MGIGLLLLLTSSAALAQDTTREEFDDTIHVIQEKPVLQKGRFELAPRVGTSINDSVYRHLKVGANANFHFSERLYLGGLFGWYDLGGTTGAYDQTIDQTSASPDAPQVKWVSGLEVGFKPLLGKFALMGSSIIYYDVGLTAGGAYLDGGSIQNPGGQTFGGMGSVNARFFLNDFTAINFEIRDVIYSATLGNAGDSLSHVVTFGAGASFYLPFSSN